MAPPNQGFFAADPWTGVPRRFSSKEDMDRAIANEGYTQASDADVKEILRRELYSGTAAKTGAAALAGAARGATFGLSDLALSKLGHAEYMRGLREYNPITTAAGDIAGTIGGLLIPGSAGSLLLKGAGKAGATTTRGVAGAAGATGALARGALGAARQAVRPMAAGAIARGEAATLAKLAAPQSAGLLADLAGVAVREGIVGAAIGAGQATSDIALSGEDYSASEVMDRLATGMKRGATVFGGLGVAGRVVGKAGTAAGRYFSRGTEQLQSAQKLAKVTKSDLAAARAITGDPAAVSAASSEYSIARNLVKDAEAAHQHAWMRGGDVAATEAALKAAQERSILAAGRLAAAQKAPNAALVGSAETAYQQAQQALAAAETNVATSVTGRALGLGLAYSMGGGIGLQALGILMGPRMLAYMGRIAGRMTGPLGAMIKDVQLAAAPEIVKTAAKWEIERAVAGYAVGGVPGAIGQLAMGRAGQALSGTAIAAAAEKMFAPTVEKIGLDVGGWAAGQAAGSRVGIRQFADNADKMGEDQIRALGSIDLTRVEAALMGVVNPDVPQDVANQAVSRVKQTMEYLQRTNPGARFPGKIPESERKAYIEKLKVVNDPEVFFKAMADAKLSSHHMEAMQAAYPEALTQVQGMLQAAIDRAIAEERKIEPKHMMTLRRLGVQVSAVPVYDPQKARAQQAQLQNSQAGRVSHRAPSPKPISSTQSAQARTQTQSVTGGLSTR